jgi:hypothetical protein
MNRKALLALQVALAGVAVAGSAHAQTINDGGASAPDSDLFLIVEDTSKGTAYVQDLGIQTNSIVTDSAMNTAVAGSTLGVLNNSISFSYSEKLDSTLSSQLSTTPGDSYTWEVVAVSSGATNNFLATTSSVAIPGTFGPGLYTNNLIRNNRLNFTNDVDNWTLLGTTFTSEPAGYTPASASFIPFSSQSGQPGTPSNVGVETWYGNGGITPVNTLATTGSSTMGFYLVSANDGTSGSNPGGVATIFDVANATLNVSNDTLTFAPAVVPLPAAVWLFGSGLLGLAGIARRRRLTAA